MRLPNILRGIVTIISTTTTVFFISPLAKAASTEISANQTSNIISAQSNIHQITAQQAKLYEPMTQWWRYDPKTDHNCTLQILGINSWGEHGQARYRVIVSADVGNLADEWGFDESTTEKLRSYIEKDMLDTWIKAFHEANREKWHIGQNPQAWLHWNAKWKHWEAYGDHSQLKLAGGNHPRKWHINVNLRASRKWSAWTLNRCAVFKEF